MANILTYGNAPHYNDALEILASGTYLTAQTVQVNNLCASGVHVVLDVTVKTGSPTKLVVTINGICPVSGKTYVLLTGGNVTGTGTNVYKVAPLATAAANAAARDFIPKTFNIVVTPTAVDADNNFTYSVGALFLR